MEDGLKNQLIQAALPHIPFDGWSAEALMAGAQDIGVDPETACFYFPKLPEDLLRHYARWQDAKMRANLHEIANNSENNNSELRSSEKLFQALMARYQEEAPYRPALHRAAALLSLPPYSALGPQMAWQTADLLWKGVGDNSLDWNYYSKRGILASILLAGFPVFLQDETPDLSQTGSFLRRRFADTAKIPRFKSAVKGWLQEKGTLSMFKGHLPPKFGFSRRPDLKMRGF